MSRSPQLERTTAALAARLRAPSPSLYPRALVRGQVIVEVGRRGLAAMVRSGVIVPLLPGVYVSPERARDHDVRCEAVAVWSKGRALIAGESALHLLDSRFPAPARVRCIGPPTWNARAPDWVHLSRKPLPSFTVWAGGVACLTAEEALLDAWACAPRRRRKEVLYRALWLRIAGPRRLIGAAARRARLPDRRGFDSIMADFVTGATSPTEVMARREVFTGEDLAELEWQVGLVVEGRRRTADALHRRARIVIELDGAAFHSSRPAVDRDRERDTELAAAGWHTVRFSFRDLQRRPEWCRRMLRRTIAARLHGPADT
ncbi:endonuclease domain-containing protein [Demequina maris]|uniref:endonuclease domain-containing protein n=1 Tax=Demequina maris TaxID=1638982 RepID=UPI0007817108|nr:DUF559 domain-containing protein [Demequina maris]